MDSSVLHIAIVLLMFGFGMGIFTAPNQSAIVGAAPRRNLATAMGVANSMRLLGSSIGTAGAGALYTGRQLLNRTRLAEQGMDSELISRLAVVESFRFILLLAGLLSLASILTALFTGGEQSKT
jgi:hypothetical protein